MLTNKKVPNQAIGNKKNMQKVRYSQIMWLKSSNNNVNFR